MPWKFCPNDDLRLVYKKVWGRYGDEESFAAHEEWDAICASRPEVALYNELQDLSRVTEYTVSIALIRKLADRYSRQWQEEGRAPKRMAYVAPEPVAFGTGRVYGTLMDTTGINFRVFDNFDAAAAYLDLSPDELDVVLESAPDAE